MKNKISLLFISFILFTISCKSPSPYASSIESLCKEIGPKKSIIGLGESTHGTKEFTIYRSAIVKELVTHHNYRIFILEAEYVACTLINQYLLDGIGDPKELLKNVNIWAWNNQDFLDLIIWMKNFNLTSASDPIHFLGMDTQFYHNYIMASNNELLQKFIEKYAYVTNDSTLKKYPIKGAQILEIENGKNHTQDKITKFKNLSKSWFSKPSEIDLDLQYNILTRIHHQSLTEPRNLNIRDENMATLVEIIHQKLNKKIILWAHNEHIFRRNDHVSNYITLGHHLSIKYKEQYSVVGFDFKEGSFYAVSRDNNDSGKMKTFIHKPLIETLLSQIDFTNSDFKILDCSTIDAPFYVNSIGATYKEDPQDVERYTSKVSGNNEFDYVFTIPLSTPSDLLDVWK